MTLIRTFTLLLNLVSAALTGAGFYTFLEPWATRMAGLEYGWMAATVAAGTLSIAVQGLVHTYWWRGGTEGLLPFNLLAATSVSLVSWVGGAGGAMLVASHGELLFAQQQQEVAGTTVPVRAFANKFAELRTDVTSLAREAGRLSELETRAGGTCRNDTAPGGGCGPRCRLRQRHAEELAGIEALAARLEGEARQIAMDMSVADNLETQRALYMQALRLQANTDQRRIVEALRSVARDLSEQIADVHPQTGAETQFSCEDPEFAARVTALASVAGNRVELPETAPRAQSVDLGDGLACVVARLGELFLGTEPCAAEVSDTPLLIAAVLEGLVIVFLLVEAMRHRQQGRVPTAPELFQLGAKRKLTERELAECTWLVQAYGKYVWTGRRASFIAVPVDGDIDASTDASRLVRYFGQPRPSHVNVPLAELQPGWVSARADVLGHPTVFNLYPFHASGLFRIRKAERDLVEATAQART